jgi:phage terminase large subunit
MQPDQYGHIWEGEYVTVQTGAYFARQIADAKSEGRIGVVAADPLLPVRAYADIGGTSQRADAFTFWIVQFVGQQIRVLHYYEAVGQEVGEHCHWLRSHGFERAEIVLPHDGVNHDRVYRVTYESAFRDAGFNARSMENAGAGAATARIEAVRRVFPQVWFNEATTSGGRDALGWYHAKQDEKRGIDLGPDHDWSSHAADAFGLMATDYAQRPTTATNTPINYRRLIR